jgi:beta-lactamase class A
MTQLFRNLTLSICSFFLLVSVQAQKKDIKLQRKIEALVNGFHGEIGVYIKDLKDNKIASINADTTFPTASIVKVPILMGIMHKISKKELDYHQKLTWVDTLNYDPGEDIVSYLKPQSQI